jgi:hypothetical protein
MKPKISVGDWRERIDKAGKSKSGRWRLLPRDLFNSRAFAELDRSGIIVVLSMLDKLSYEKRGKKKDRKGVRISVPVIKDNGEFTITNNELKARGLTSPEGIAKGRRQAWELGFFDVLRTGSVTQYGWFKYSSRWRQYPDGDYRPVDQPDPGACLYPRPKKSNAAV